MLMRSILSTSGTRILNAIAGLLLLWIAANELGAEAWGISGIILLDISLILLFVDMMSSTLVYFTPRRNPGSLMIVSYFWTLFVTMVAAMIFALLYLFAPTVLNTLVPKAYAGHILMLVILNSLHSIHMNILLGKGKMAAFNSLFSLQFSLMLAAMAAFVYWAGIRSEKAFVFALYVSYSIPACAGLFIIKPRFNRQQVLGFRALLIEMMRFGSVMQLSGVLHLLNKRISYFFIKAFTGYAAVGIYNSGVQLTEGLRLIGQSISLVQYSRISNSNDTEYARLISIRLLKFSVLTTTLALLVLIAIPRSVFEHILTRDFGDITLVILSLSPGVIALSANTIFSHYFSGTGKPAYNLTAALIGLGLSIPLLLLFIPLWGLTGAGIGTSLAYLATVVYQWFMFRKMTKTKLREMLPDRNDFRELMKAIKMLRPK